MNATWISTLTLITRATKKIGKTIKLTFVGFREKVACR